MILSLCIINVILQLISFIFILYYYINNKKISLYDANKGKNIIIIDFKKSKGIKNIIFGKNKLYKSVLTNHSIVFVKRYLDKYQYIRRISTLSKYYSTPYAISTNTFTYNEIVRYLSISKEIADIWCFRVGEYEASLEDLKYQFNNIKIIK